MLFKIYSGLADSCGVPQLAKKLNKVKNLQCWKHKLAFVTVSNVGLKCIFCILFFLEIPWKILPLQILIGFQYLKFKHVICLFTCISLQILAQHIKSVLPGLRARISASLVTIAKEHASYGEITESKACVNIWMCPYNLLMLNWHVSTLTGHLPNFILDSLYPIGWTGCSSP